MEFDQETVDSFMIEFREHIEEAVRHILLLENNPQDAEAIHALFRSLHTIKGNASVLELERISRLSHEAETLLDSIREQTIEISSDIIETLLTTADALTALVDEAQGAGTFDESKIDDLIQTISGYLPREAPLKKKPHPVQKKGAKLSAQGSSAPNKILVVDDEKTVRDVLEEAFVKASHTVRCADSAEDCLEALKQENIQVMFLDLRLPGMNGVDLCKQIRKDKPIAVLYAMTGYTSLFELADCRDAGFDDYFTKPFDLKVVLKAADDAFDKIHRWKSQ